MCPVLRIVGGQPLEGELQVNGSKNAALPIIAATLLTDGEVRLKNVPDLVDVRVMLSLCRVSGMEFGYRGGDLIVRTGQIRECPTRPEAGSIRASILLAGPLLARCGHFQAPLPGGCSIGDRGIDFHIQALRMMGAQVAIGSDMIRVRTGGLHGAQVELPFPSVGATENIMMAATLAEGRTRILNAAREPEIVDLATFLNRMGAAVEGAGTSHIQIKGVEELKGAGHEVMPDRIEMGTLMAAGAITRGRLTLKRCPLNTDGEFFDKVAEMGIELSRRGSEIAVACEEHRPADIRTGPYPGFATDLQPIMAPLLSLADGESTIVEGVFDNRFNYVSELRKMGFRAEGDGRRQTIRGPTRLQGCNVVAPDIRGGASLIVAALGAEGVTNMASCQKVFRGYERIDQRLRSVGADIELMGEDDDLEG